MIDKLIHPLPRRAREAVGRLLKADRVLAAPDRAERAAYKDRVAPEASTKSAAKAETKPSEEKSASLS